VEKLNPLFDSKQFGYYLRQVREDRKLSLDAVEEMTLSFPGRVTKSHLSRIENGQAEPTFPRMFALSQVYGIPISSLAERFEVDLRREMTPGRLITVALPQIVGEASNLMLAGRYEEALARYEIALERFPDSDNSNPDVPSLAHLRLRRAGCLIKLSRFASAKDECEDVLNSQDLPDEERVRAMHLFTESCFNLGKYTIAMMAVGQLEHEVEKLPAASPLRAHFASLRGNLLASLGKAKEAAVSFRDAIDRFEKIGNEFEVCRHQLNYARTLIDCGKPKEAQRQLIKITQQARKRGLDRQLAHGLSELGMLAFRQGDLSASESYCLQSNTTAREREFIAIVFRNCYYLMKIAAARGDTAAVRSNGRTLRAYLNRIPGHVPEALAFRRDEAGES
jgi:tetratricopeptide (TPR) repeat protein